MDTLPAHRVIGARAAIEAAGARLIDFNPIQQAFAKPKALLRKAAALDAFTPDACTTCSTNSGYVPDRSEKA